MIDPKRFDREILAHGFSSFRDGRLAQVQNGFEPESHAIPTDYDPNLLARAHNERFLKATTGRRCVYFIQAGRSGPVKIGTALDLRERVIDLQCGNHEALFVLGVLLGGDRALEQELHQRFWSDWIRGEWFRRSDALIAFMRSLPDVNPNGLTEDRPREGRTDSRQCDRAGE